VNNRSAIVLLVVSCLLAAAAVFQSFRFSQSEEASRARTFALVRETGEAIGALTEMRRAQAAYLATGQGPEFWMRRAQEIATDVDAAIARLRSLTGEASTSYLDVAASSLAELVALDGRARTANSSGQAFLASDIVFAESEGAAARVAEALAAARDVEAAAIEAVAERQRMIQLALVPATLVLVLLAAWMAGSSRAASKRTALTKNEEVAQMLRELPPAVKSPGVPAIPNPPVPTPPAPKLVPPKPVVEVSAVADLCVDLARVASESEMPDLLARAARTLGASGLIVWVVDTAGERLTPAFAHGYSERVLSRMGTLEVQDDNITSTAFRTGKPQTVPGAREGASGAIAVPLVVSSGCHGVLSAEVPGPAPAPERVAGSQILAAQLGGLLSPIESQTQSDDRPAESGSQTADISGFPEEGTQEA
jgi:CHASE3 domain sensor protein